MGRLNKTHDRAQGKKKKNSSQQLYEQSPRQCTTEEKDDYFQQYKLGLHSHSISPPGCLFSLIPVQQKLS
jgi:hypothetical protein